MEEALQEIFYETHGVGPISFKIDNGANSSSSSRLDGNVYAPYAAISIGSGTGCSQINGSLWSGTQTIINCGVTINYCAPAACTTPNANAGLDKIITCTNNTVQLDGSSPTSGVSYSWAGPGIVSGGSTPTPIVNAAGTYTLTVNSNGCTATDQVNVTLNTSAPNANGGSNKVLDCNNSSVTLDGSSTTLGVNFSWTGPGIVSGAGTASPIVNAAGSYTLTVSNPVNGCTATSQVLVTTDLTAPNANAGTNKVLDCNNSTITLDGSSLTAGVNFSWTGPSSYFRWKTWQML